MKLPFTGKTLESIFSLDHKGESKGRKGESSAQGVLVTAGCVFRLFCIDYRKSENKMDIQYTWNDSKVEGMMHIVSIEAQRYFFTS